MDWVSPGVDGYQALLVGHTVGLLESWFSLLTQLTLLSPQMPLSMLEALFHKDPAGTWLAKHLEQLCVEICN